MSNKSKTLARHGSLDEYVDSLPAHAEKPEVWVNINDDSCINVSHIGSKYAYYSEDGSSDSHSMDIKHFTENYRLAGLGKELAPAADDTFNDDTVAQTFSDLEDSLPHYKCPECDTSYKLYRNRVSIERDGMCCKCFDETKAVEDIAWDIGTDERCESILVTVCSKCGSTVPADNVEDSALSRWAARFLKAVKGIEVGK